MGGGTDQTHDSHNGTSSCIVFPPSNWKPNRGFQPCSNQIDFPKCHLQVPPQAAGGQIDKPWITCTDGKAPDKSDPLAYATDGKGNWSYSNMFQSWTQNNAQFAPATNPLPYRWSAAKFDDTGPRGPQSKKCLCMAPGWSHQGDDVCSYVACADWTPWVNGASDDDWPHGLSVPAASSFADACAKDNTKPPQCETPSGPSGSGPGQP